ncbi:AI-2E family transporter [Aerococcaceae bacterium INB8]|uniref:AI-2E family transporter n=1 Tax=Ruoffia halotolerans TaxID=2748684 RepID=A0A839A5Z2_9LACT|nr:AI-2E family transporter [Ruoffia halotolerans]MBA5729422.1 AI-2E family transporter [Ruoffia halotolerans]
MTDNNRNEKRKESWFVSQFLNNQFVIFLFNTLLILLIILIFTRVAYLFTPIVTFVNLVTFPIVAAGILYYVFSPFVAKLIQRGVSRNFSIWIIFIIIIALISWGISTLIPLLREQATTFVENIPNYQASLMETIESLPIDLESGLIDPNITEYFANIDWNSITDQLNMIITSTFGGLGSVIGTVAQVVTGLITMPVLLYYLLLEGYKIPQYILYHVPDKYRPKVGRILLKSNHQISQYIRGQILVAIVVGIMFAIGYSFIGLDYAISLSVIAGIFNIIPYLGSIMAVVPALIIGLSISPYMFIKVLIVVAIEQLLEGRFVSPQILGNNLKIHPVTILLVLLGAGRLFGLSGVIIGVPGYAVIKVIVTELYNTFRESSGLFEEEYKVETLAPEVIASPVEEKE